MDGKLMLNRWTLRFNNTVWCPDAQSTHSWSSLHFPHQLRCSNLWSWISSLIMTQTVHVAKPPQKPPCKCTFLKSNSFINILQSFIHGYVIIYFFQRHFASVIIPCCLMTTNEKQTEVWRMSRRYIFFFAKGQREIHISARTDLSSCPLVKKQNEKS